MKHFTIITQGLEVNVIGPQSNEGSWAMGQWSINGEIRPWIAHAVGQPVIWVMKMPFNNTCDVRP